MSRPDDIPQDVWIAAAVETAGPLPVKMGDTDMAEVANRVGRWAHEVVARAILADREHRSGWRSIDSVPRGEIVDIWVEVLGGEGFRIKDAEVVGDVPYRVVIRDKQGDGDADYLPHENGAYLTHWMRVPSPSPRDMVGEAGQ